MFILYVVVFSLLIFFKKLGILFIIERWIVMSDLLHDIEQTWNGQLVERQFSKVLYINVLIV